MTRSDYRLTHTLDSFSAHHDSFEDLLRAYVASAEILFLALIVAYDVKVDATTGDVVHTGQDD